MTDAIIIDGKSFAVAECLKAARVIIKTNQHQRRFQGHRRKGIGSDAHGYALGRYPGDDGDTGGEKT